MKKLLPSIKLLLVLLTLSTSVSAVAQKKIFSKIAGAIDVKLYPIIQSNQTVGYAYFAKLEKVAKDSFAYSIELLDENLNSLSTVKFRNTDLICSSISFESDVVTIAFRQWKKKYDYRPADRFTLMMINLDGKILSQKSFEVTRVYDMQLYNIPGKGFLLNALIDYTTRDFSNRYYGLKFFDLKGEKFYEEAIDENYEPINIMTNAKLVSYYLKNQKMFVAHDVNNPSKKTSLVADIPKDINFKLGTSQTHNDKIYYTGAISKSNALVTAGGLPVFLGTKGFFSVEVSSTDSKIQFAKKYDFLEDNKHPLLNNKAEFYDKAGERFVFLNSYRDSSKNIYYVGYRIKRKPRLSSIVSSAIFLPLVIVTPLIALNKGYSDYCSGDYEIFKQTPKNNITSFKKITMPEVKMGTYLELQYNKIPSLMVIDYADLSANYLIVKTEDEYKIINSNNGVEKKYPINKNGIVTKIFSAKEGHILLHEYDENSSTTKLSIEPLN